MSYSKQITDNKSKIKKFSHLKRFKIAKMLVEDLNPNSVLDYGTGNGFLLTFIAQSKQDIDLYGYERIVSMYDELVNHIKDSPFSNIHCINNLKEVEGQRFEVVTCLEVLEHFNENYQKEFLNHIKNITTVDSKIIISVPIETGLSSLFKNLIRYVVKQKHSNTSLSNVIKSIFGLHVDRINDKPYINSHVGFNYKHLEKLILKEGFEITKKKFSPFHILGGIVNSQVFYILKK